MMRFVFIVTAMVSGPPSTRAMRQTYAGLACTG